MINNFKVRLQRKIQPKETLSKEPTLRLSDINYMYIYLSMLHNSYNSPNGLIFLMKFKFTRSPILYMCHGMDKRTSRVSSLTGRAELTVLGLHMRTAKKEVACDDRSVESFWNVLSSHEIELGL